MDKSIRKREKRIYSRKIAGHWKLDSVVSGQGKSKVCFATFSKRKTRFFIAVKITDRKAATMENAIVETLSRSPKELAKMIACDRRFELANWANIKNNRDAML